MIGAIIPWGRAYGQRGVDEVREFLSRIAGTVWGYFPELAMMRTQRASSTYVVDVEFLEIPVLLSEVSTWTSNATWRAIGLAATACCQQLCADLYFALGGANLNRGPFRAFAASLAVVTARVVYTPWLSVNLMSSMTTGLSRIMSTLAGPRGGQCVA